MNRKLCTATLILAASPALAQPVGDVTWTMIAEPGGGPTFSINVWADLDPDVNGSDVIGFAGSIFDITGNTQAHEYGQITDFQISPDLSRQSQDPTLDGASILGIETFQIPPAFNGDFDASDPILVFSFDWTWDGRGFQDRVEFMTTNRINMDVYFSNLGGSQPWTATEGGWAFAVPTPSSAAVLALSGILTCTRSRR